MGRIRSHLGSWPGVVAFVLIVRLSLNVPALLGARFISPEATGLRNVPSALTLPGVWSRWDSSYYLGIAASGYPYHAPEVNFWPGYPMAIRLVSLGHAPAMHWAGIGVSIACLLAASLLLWMQVALDSGRAVAWATVITLNLFPTSFFFSAIYSESLFLLFSVLVYWFSARNRYALSAVFVALASITRIYGILLLVIPLIEMLRGRGRLSVPRIAIVVGVSFSLLAIYGSYLALTQGSPLASLYSQQELMKRSVTLPGVSLWHAVAVALLGYGGFEANWFMRVTSAHDSFMFLLFTACAVAGFFLLPRKSLALYGAVAMLALAISHGPYALGLYSMSRYALAVFPAFVVMGLVFTRFPTLRTIVWTLMALLLFGLTAWFASGRWVA